MRKYENHVLIPLLVDDPLWENRLSANNAAYYKVLIPLLVDDPLWDTKKQALFTINETVLIPLLVDDPLWVALFAFICLLFVVLIPLLVDDPLWEAFVISKRGLIQSLNPSFSG